MKLTEYPTPITDGKSFFVYGHISEKWVSPHVCRDLEQKLAHCRSQIEDVRRFMLASNYLTFAEKLKTTLNETE